MTKKEKLIIARSQVDGNQRYTNFNTDLNCGHAHRINALASSLGLDSDKEYQELLTQELSAIGYSS